jgi:hypothetical protein
MNDEFIQFEKYSFDISMNEASVVHLFNGI